MSSNPIKLGYWIPGVHSQRALKFLAADGLALAVSMALSLAVQFQFRLPADCISAMPELIFWIVAAKLSVFYCFRQFHVLPDFFGIRELVRLALANGYTSVALLMMDWGFLVQYSPPRSVFIVDFLLSLLLLATLRLALRMRREIMRSKGVVKQPRRIRRVGIVGAGEAGVMLANDLRSKKSLGMDPVVFFDDNPRKLHAQVCGIPVVGRPELLLTDAKARLGLEEVIISMPSAPSKRIREVIDVLGRAKLKFKTVPSLIELATGRVQVSQLRSVEVEDLLGRLPVELATGDIRNLIKGRCVVVTGAGGSIGSELCRQIAAYEPRLLLLVERSEVSMFAIEQELIASGYKAIIVPLVADILDEPRIRRMFEQYRPDVLFHAAAHKHVPMMESQPAEAVRNNSMGTALLAEIASDYGVERFVLISTDKAINPTSVMGTTKRLAELFLQAFFASNRQGTRYMAVRFGNVLGSSGSVIPVFKRQIAAGGPVTVTHPDVTRYFMTIPEAVGLVLQSAVLGKGGEIFVLDMGKPVKIVDLARQLIELSGLQPEKDIPIEFVGLRPGEKLYEELNLGRELCTSTEHPKIMRLQAEPQSLEEVRRILGEFRKRLHTADHSELKHLLKQAVPEYTPEMLDGGSTGAGPLDAAPKMPPAERREETGSIAATN